MTAVESQSPAAPTDAPSSDRKIGLFMAIGGAIALWASLVLTNDKIKLLQAEVEGESLELGCDLSAFVSCGDVVSSAQSAAFGFPNTFIGVVAFSALVALGVVLASGIRLPEWMWAGLQIGALGGIAFVTWLQYQAIFVIGKLCPWCMVVWAVMIPLFVVITARFTRNRFLRDWTALVISLWFVALAAIIWFTFGETLWA